MYRYCLHRCTHGCWLATTSTEPDIGIEKKVEILFSERKGVHMARRRKSQKPSQADL